ncbi:L,D-transpeptidase [Patescibacteria group bacterium]
MNNKIKVKIKTKVLLILILLEICFIGYFLVYPRVFTIKSYSKLFTNPHKIVFYFNQPIIRESFEKEFQISPNVGGNFDWSDYNRQVSFTPYYLTYNSDYIISVKNIRSYALTELEERNIKFRIEPPSSINFASLINISPIILPISEKNVFVKPDKKTVVLSKPKTNEGKYIDVDISDQVMILYENDKIMGIYEVSTGRYNMPTPLGEFKISKKEENHWSRTYGLYMPFSMEFIPGFYVHELPYWPNGYREGEDHLGTRVSHGCIRLGIGPAEKVYNFANIGTPIIVHQ